MKSKFKQLASYLILPALIIFSTEASASGIPVVDAAAIELAQKHQLENFAQMLKDYQQMVLQYQQAVNTYKNFTGTRGFGMAFYDLNLRQFLPSNFESQIRNAVSGGLNSLSTEGKALFDEWRLGEVCSNLPAKDKTVCEREQAGFAEFNAMMQKGRETVSQRLSRMENLISQIQTATDAKAIADLSAQIQAEKNAFDASREVAASQIEQAKAMRELQERNIAQIEHQTVFRRLSDAEISEQLTK